MGGTWQLNQPGAGPTPETELQDADSRTPDSDHDIKKDDLDKDDPSGEPWFVKLPPDLQRAIRAKSRTRAPRGYEERLRRYYESVD